MGTINFIKKNDFDFEDADPILRIETLRKKKKFF